MDCCYGGGVSVIRGKGNVRNTPQTIPDNWKPSTNLCRWAQQMNIDHKIFQKCLFDFRFWHTEKNVKRANFNMAFKNWLKKELEIDAKKIKPASFSEWKREENINVADKATALNNIMKIKGIL